jgi:hypothetical protein
MCGSYHRQRSLSSGASLLRVTHALDGGRVGCDICSLVRSSDALPRQGGLHTLPTDIVARYADPAIKPSHPAQRERMERLTRTIARHGILNPLTIKVEGGRAHVFDGNHRLAVAQRLGIPLLPVIVKHEDKLE